MTEKLRAQIRAGRGLLGLSQKDFGEIIGASFSKISKAENGLTKEAGVLDELKQELERLGVVFLPTGGVDILGDRSYSEVIKGKDCYFVFLGRLLDMEPAEELLVGFATDRASRPEVNERYRELRARGVKMRQLIAADDDYILGPFEEYRTVPNKYFTNLVTVIYGNILGELSGNEEAVRITRDPRRLEAERNVFEFFWDHGEAPVKTSAGERF